MAKRTLRCVVFDLDGTLIDTMQTFADVAAQVMHEHHDAESAVARRRYLETSGIPFEHQLQVMYPDDPRNADAVRAFEDRKVKATGNVPPSQDTAEALASLKLAGLKLAVSSNNFQANVDDFAKVCPVPLDLLLGFGAELAKGAPHFDKVCAELELRAKDLLFVGDSLKDGELARACKVDFIGKVGTFPATAFDEAGYEHVDTIAGLAKRVLS